MMNEMDAMRVIAMLQRQLEIALIANKPSVKITNFVEISQALEILMKKITSR